MFSFNKRYFLFAVLLFITEILIAAFLHDRFVRPYVGDFLVVLLIYCFVKSFINTPPIPTAIGVLLFAYAIETLQYFKVVKLFGLQHSKLANTVIGNSFEWMDMVAYTAGFVLLVFIERNKPKNNLIRASAN